MAIEDNIDVRLLAVDCVLPLPLEHSYPDLISFQEVQHEALALHDAPLTGLTVEDRHFVFILHDVQVGLLVVPGVDIQVEEVDPGNVAEEAASKHVEMLVEVDELRVESDPLIVIQTVEGFAASDRKGSVMLFAGVAGGPHLTLLSFLAMGSLQAWLT